VPDRSPAHRARSGRTLAPGALSADIWYADVAGRGPIYRMCRGMTVDDFWEIGASGHRYSRAYVLDELEKRFAVPHVDIWEATDFHCRRLADDIYLLTYTLLQDRKRRTRRSTIWQRAAKGWKIVRTLEESCPGRSCSSVAEKSSTR
jgi:hypothetical protein